MTSCWKSLDKSLNNCEWLPQESFVTLGPTLTYTTSNLNNLSNFLETSQCIDGKRCNHKKPALLPQSYTSLWEKQISMSGLDTAYWKIAITPNDKFQDQWTLTQEILYTQINNQQNNSWEKNLKEILYQAH